MDMIVKVETKSDIHEVQVMKGRIHPNPYNSTEWHWERYADLANYWYERLGFPRASEAKESEESKCS